MTHESPFHEGELALQAKTGVIDKVARYGQRGIRPFMPEEHREFFEQLPFAFAASLSPSGQPWASLVWGLPGFVSSPEPTVLEVAGSIAPGDPLLENLSVGAPIGMLGIELSTRRRNRANGVIMARDGASFTLGVTQSFGNCQKYIQARTPKYRRDPRSAAGSPAAVESASLSTSAQRIIETADTCFIASRSRAPSSSERGQGVDVSHRGGPPGFVAVERHAGTTVLTMPDYIGNFLFNTLGNIEVDSRAGLLFVDFESGSLLALAGRATVIWDGPEVEVVDGAERLLRVAVEHGYLARDALPFGWSPPEFAPQFGRV